MSDFAGLVAVVTGGSSGIGAAIVRRLRDEGASVAVFDRAAPDPDDTGADDSDYHAVDVTDDASVRHGIDAVTSRYGRLDIVINNAGVGAQGTIADNPDDEWHRVLDVNLLGVVRVSRAALPWLRDSPHAAVVNLASIAATAGLPQRALYGASKGAVLALTLQMAADHLDEGIRVNVVCPGTADTPWVARLLANADDPAAERRALEARQPHGRLVTADEVADAVVYLAGPRAGSTTGTSLAVDGGMSGLRLRRR